jgi:hypothetical protein
VPLTAGAPKNIYAWPQVLLLVSNAVHTKRTNSAVHKLHMISSLGCTTVEHEEAVRFVQTHNRRKSHVLAHCLSLPNNKPLHTTQLNMHLKEANSVPVCSTQQSCCLTPTYLHVPCRHRGGAVQLCSRGSAGSTTKMLRTDICWQCRTALFSQYQVPIALHIYVRLDKAVTTSQPRLTVHLQAHMQTAPVVG